MTIGKIVIRNWKLENITKLSQFIAFNKADAISDYIGIKNDVKWCKS